MADSSETQSKADAEIQQSKRDQQDSSFLETLVPIPDFFFNIKAEIEPIGGSKWRIHIFAYILYFITLCVIFGSFAYYSRPAQRELESIVTSNGKALFCVQSPPEDHFARSEHGLQPDAREPYRVRARKVSTCRKRWLHLPDFVSLRKTVNCALFEFDVWSAKSFGRPPGTRMMVMQTTSEDRFS